MPNRAASDADNVTQNVTAITLASNQNPAAIKVYLLNRYLKVIMYVYQMRSIIY